MHESVAECPFDRLLLNPQNAPNYVASGEFGTLFVNPNQSHHGRCVYVFHRHVEDPMLLQPNEFAGFAREVLTYMKLVKKTFRPILVNVALLGNGVPHLHWHIIPRYSDDPNIGGPPWPHRRVEVGDDQLRSTAELLRESLENV